MQCVLSNTQFIPVSNLIPFSHPLVPNNCAPPCSNISNQRKTIHTQLLTFSSKQLLIFQSCKCEIKLETSSEIVEMLETLGYRSCAKIRRFIVFAPPQLN